MKSSGGKVYEVRCSGCNVSFPPETRRCMHCGGRTSPGGSPPSPKPAFPIDPAGAVASEQAREEEGSWLTLPDLNDTTDEEPPARPGWLRLGGGLVWVVLAILASLGQMCEGR